MRVVGNEGTMKKKTTIQQKMHNKRNDSLLCRIETNELDDGAVFDDMSIRHHPKALLAFVRESDKNTRREKKIKECVRAAVQQALQHALLCDGSGRGTLHKACTLC